MPCALETDKLIGVVLAGGKSSRMGTNKALLPFQRCTLLEHMLSLLHTIPVRESFISGQYAGFSCITDLTPSQGPLGGIYSVLDMLFQRKTDYTVIFLPVDMPMLTVEVLRSLISALATYDAVYCNNHPLPFVMQVNEQLRLQLQEDKEMMRGAVHQFLARLNSRFITIPEQVLFNVNTPGQWSRVVKSSQSR